MHNQSTLTHSVSGRRRGGGSERGRTFMSGSEGGVSGRGRGGGRERGRAFMSGGEGGVGGRGYGCGTVCSEPSRGAPMLYGHLVLDP